MFSYQKLHRATAAEAARAARDQTGRPLWVVKVVSARDYHRVGDIVIVEEK